VFALKIDPTTQPFRDDSMDHMQTKAGSAEMTARREEGIEGQPFNIRRHAAAVIDDQ
jgi:hypothetical protein